MAFLSIHHLAGNPDELLAQKSEHMDPVVNRIAPDYGAILSVTAKVEDGLLTINLWESATGAAEFTARNDIQAAQLVSGLPRPSRFERYDDVRIDRYQ